MRLIRFPDQGTPGGVPTITREMEIQPGLVSQIGLDQGVLVYPCPRITKMIG